MAVNGKITYIFNAQKNGWTETWYNTAENLGQIMVNAVAVAVARANLLGLGSQIEAIRVSDDNIVNDSIVDFTAFGPTDGTVKLQPRDSPWNALLCRANSGTLYRRQLWLRGIPDAWITVDPITLTYTLSPTFLRLFNTFTGVLTKNNFQIKALAKEAVLAPVRIITQVAQDVSQVFRITAPAHGFANTNEVRIYGVKGQNVTQVNGVWHVYDVTADTFLVPEPVGIGQLLYKGGGKVKKRVYSYYNINSLTYLRVSKHNTGRAFFVTRGRRAVKK
jgi:uncharacterized protein with HEPN domain